MKVILGGFVGLALGIHGNIQVFLPLLRDAIADLCHRGVAEPERDAHVARARGGDEPIDLVRIFEVFSD